MRKTKYTTFFLEPENIDNNNGRYLIFSSALIASDLHHPIYHGQDGGVRGFNLLKDNQWLIRTSSIKGVLTVDFKKNDKQISFRCYLADHGWELDSRNFEGLKYCTDVETSIASADQLIELLNSLDILDGLEQILPNEDMAAKDELFSVYRIKLD